MKLLINNISIRALGLVLLVTLMLSFGNCDNKKGRQSHSGTGKNKSICSIHNKDCKSKAIGLGMSLKEYHQWQNKQIEAIKEEDESTNSGGDIVDPDSKMCSLCNGTGKVVTGCSGMPFWGKCNNGYYRCRNNCKLGNTGWYYDSNGEICKECKGNGKTECGSCSGMGERYYRYCDNCDASGKVK